MMNKGNFIDAMAELDADLLTEHFERKCPTKAQKLRKYAMAVAAYAAACLVIALIIPFVVGRGEAPKPPVGKEPVTDQGVVNTDKPQSSEPEKDPPREKDNTSAVTTFCGCDFTITLDKESYTLDDTITATVTLTNNGDKAVGLWQGYLGDFLDEIEFYENGEVRWSYSSEWDYGYPEACQWGPFEPGGSITHVVEFTPGAPNDTSDPVASMESLWEITAFVAYYTDVDSDPEDSESIKTATVTVEVPHDRGESGTAESEDPLISDPEKPVSTTEPEVTDPEKPDSSNELEVSDPENITPEKSKIYPKPADSVRIRFFKDKKMTDEYKSASAIPYGAKVYYKIECDAGYICTNVKFNVYTVSADKEYRDGGWYYYDYFINEYEGGRLEYSCTAVLAGDVDGNLYYDMNDANILKKYIDGDASTRYHYGYNGYSEKLDYDCNGTVDNDDYTEMLDEIHGYSSRRNVMSLQKYTRSVGSKTYLLDNDDVVVLPRGDNAGYIEYNWNVFKDVYSIRKMSDEIKEKYDEEFFNDYNLVMVYCYTPNAVLDKIWCAESDSGAAIHTDYSDVNTTGNSFGDYAICIAVSGNINIKDPAPV